MLLLVNVTSTRKWLSDQSFKSLHIKNIKNILQSVYEPIGHWDKGVVDLEWDTERWSILNRINTNYSSLIHLINGINELLFATDPSSQFNFNSEFKSETFWMEYNRFIEFLNRNREKIFLKTTKDNGSIIINKIVATISKTKAVGDDAEVKTKEYLKLINPNITNIRMPETSGQMTDMVGGVDIFFKYNNQEFTVQVKKCKDVVLEGDYYIIKGVGISKHYNVNYISAVTYREIYFFWCDNTKIQLTESGDIRIHKSLLKKSFKL